MFRRLFRKKIKKFYKADRVDDLDIPSPYLTGVFDDIIANEPNATWNAVIETNRGCPFACTFCDWGSLTYSKVKKFTEIKIYQELEWIGRNKIDYLAFADANFGIFKDRDYQIAKKLCEVKQNYGYPSNINISYNKNSTNDVINIIQLFSESSLSRGMTVSFQSLDDNVLKNIKRTNMEINKAEQIFHTLETKNLHYYSELILGLPGETTKSWTDGLFNLLEYGQHQCIDIFFTQLLENSELNSPAEREKYNIKLLMVDASYSHTTLDNNDNYPAEKQFIIKSTDSMSTTELIQCFCLSWVIVNFHCHGWTQIYSRFLNCYKNIPYREFYEKLHQAIVDRQLNYLSDQYYHMSDDIKTYFNNNDKFFEEKKNSDLLRNSQKHFFVNKELVHNTLKQFIHDNFKLEPQILDNLHEYQKNFISDYDCIYPYSATLDYGIKKAITHKQSYVSELLSCIISVDDRFIDKNDFLKKITMRRRNGFGKTLIEKV